MTNIEKFNAIIENECFETVGSLTAIRNKTFSNEVIKSHNLMELNYVHLTFSDCTFIDIDFRHTYFLYCNFTNCNFTNTVFLKSELESCNFKHCQLFQCDFGKANVIENNFTDCRFDNVCMVVATFTECEFIKPKFYVDDLYYLNSVILDKSKVCNSKKCIEVNDLDRLSEILDKLKE